MHDFIVNWAILVGVFTIALASPGPDFVIAVRNSPKPPAERISLTLPALNNSKNVWVVASGADKADAIYAAFTSENPSEAPVSAVPAGLVPALRVTLTALPALV